MWLAGSLYDSLTVRACACPWMTFDKPMHLTGIEEVVCVCVSVSGRSLGESKMYFPE